MSRVKHPPLLRIQKSSSQDGLIIKILRNVLKLLRGQINVRPKGGRNWDGGRSNYQGGTILHSLRQSSEGLIGGNDNRRNRSSLDLSSSRRGGSPLNRRCLGKRMGDLTNLPSMSTFIYGYRLSGKGRSLNRNSMRVCRSGKCCKLSPTKKALHGCAHGYRKLLGSRTIYRKRLGLILEDKKKGGGGGRRYEDQSNLFWKNKEIKSIWQTGE